jgi:hypothetical protein
MLCVPGALKVENNERYHISFMSLATIHTVGLYNFEITHSSFLWCPTTTVYSIQGGRYGVVL